MEDKYEKKIQEILQKIRDKRKSLKITQEKIGIDLGMTQSSYKELENGKTQIKLISFLKICEYLNINMRDLYFSEKDKLFLINQSIEKLINTQKESSLKRNENFELIMEMLKLIKENVESN
ncbi:MAG: helix-turn-helix transcriptional regulator [Flammeovirgaceae bacterium]|nr:helix-turn-helix transcriptional regulator [Flammeovirgaceae bacterium]